MKKSIILIGIVSTLAFASNSTVPVVTDELYIKECGSCHFAYQPQLLPKGSWAKMMDGLKDHFGTNATLETKEFDDIRSYLISNSKSGDGPLRISQLRKFRKEHRDIPSHYISQKEVGSISNCSACHTSAEKGSYRERDIYIPNYGRWND